MLLMCSSGLTSSNVPGSFGVFAGGAFSGADAQPDNITANSNGTTRCIQDTPFSREAVYLSATRFAAQQRWQDNRAEAIGANELSRPLHAHSATELAALIRRREVSSVDVVTAHLARIAEVNGELNAVVQLAPDALDRARQADRVLAANHAVGELHGVPFTVKDWIETEGLICAAGFEERRDYRPKRDAVAVERLRTAGAVLLGKTNVTQGRPVYRRPQHQQHPPRTHASSWNGRALIV